METLSPLDASFLLLERAWAPMHFGGLSIVDPGGREGGPLTEAELEAAVLQRFRRLRRLHQRPVFRWRGLRHAVWERAPLDPAKHFHHHELAVAGDQAELLRLVGLLHAAPLDHRRPLWELHLIDGLAGGRQAILMKVHHSVADGLGGLDVADALFDRAPGRRHTQRRERVHDAVPAWLAMLQLLLGAGQLVAGGLLAPVPLFNRPVGPRREFAIATVPAADLRAAKRRLGGTADDVLLEMVLAGLRRHLEWNSNCVPAAVRVMVPISTRGLLGGLPGNHVTAMFIDVPLGGDPEPFVASVSAVKGLMRQVHEGPALEALVRASGLLPAPLQGAVARLVTAWPMFNLVVSDIPGRSEPYRLLGARVEAMFPLMPLAPTTGLSVAAISVGGVVGIGVTADPSQLADAAGLAAEIEAAARDLGRLPRRSRRSAA